MKEKKKTYSEIILLVLEDAKGEWVESYKLIKIHTPYGWLGTSADRNARKLVEDSPVQAFGKEYTVERDGRENHRRNAKYRVTQAIRREVRAEIIEIDGIRKAVLTEVEIPLFQS